MNTLPSKSFNLRSLGGSHAVFGKTRQLVDTAVALNVVVAACFTAVGGFFELAATGNLSLTALIVLFLTTWQIYIVDRLGKHPEDESSGSTNGSFSSDVTQNNQRFVLGLMVVALAIQTLCVIHQPQVVIGIGLGAMGGAGYVVKLPIIRCRLKQIPCAKTFYIPFVCIAMALGTTGEWLWAYEHWGITLGVWMLIFINALVFDIKDAERDLENGVCTFFNLFPYSSVLTAAVIASCALAVSMAVVPSLLHLCLFTGAIGTVLLLLPLYWLEEKLQVEPYLTHIFEWNIAIPFFAFIYLSV